MCIFMLMLVTMSVGSVTNGDVQQTTEKELRPEYIHPEGVLNFDPYLSDIKPEAEVDDYITLPDNDETIDGLPIFLLEPKNSYALRTKPATLLCKAANALQVFFKCNNIRVDKVSQLDHVNPQNGVRVVEAELNITRSEVEYFDGKYSCECYAWNGRGKIRSQAVFVEYAYIKKHFIEHPESLVVEAGRTVSFRCRPPLAAPPATIKWLRNGMIIDKMEENLLISNVRLQDMANYSCVAENIAGHRESNVATLTVYVNGGWSEWSSWVPCVCGSQSQGRQRSRTCTQPSPANGGAPCRGQATQDDERCIICHNDETWSPWGAWSLCSEDCVRNRERECSGPPCSGPSLQHAACVDGYCTTGLRLYKSNTALYVGVGVTIAMLISAVALMIVWCKHRNNNHGYLSGRVGVPKPTNMRDKNNTGPDVTRSCNEYWMQRSDNHYDMPQLRDSYASPFGNRQHTSSGSGQYEMKPYSPSGESASSCYTNTRTLTSHSSEYSSQLGDVGTCSRSTPLSKVDVAVTLPNVSLESSYRDKICLTIVK